MTRCVIHHNCWQVICTQLQFHFLPSLPSLINKSIRRNFYVLEFFNSNTYTFLVSTGGQEVPFKPTHMLLPIIVHGISSLRFILIKPNKFRQYWREEGMTPHLERCLGNVEWSLLKGQIHQAQCEWGPCFVSCSIPLVNG